MSILICAYNVLLSNKYTCVSECFVVFALYIQLGNPARKENREERRGEHPDPIQGLLSLPPCVSIKWRIITTPCIHAAVYPTQITKLFKHDNS